VEMKLEVDIQRYNCKIDTVCSADAPSAAACGLKPHPNIVARDVI